MENHETNLVKPPSVQAIDKALQILLDSIEEETGTDLGSSTRGDPDLSLQTLRRKRDALETAHTVLFIEARNRAARLARQHNSLVPISKLPFELTADILLRSLEPKDHEGLVRIYSLSSVQTIWWHVITGHPSFWTVIHMNDPSVLARKVGMSGGLPLDVCCGEDVTSGAVLECVAQLVDFRERFQTFSWEWTTCAPVRDLLSRARNLEHLIMMPKKELLGNGINLHGSPRLRHIQLRRASLEWKDVENLGQLRTLSLSSCTILVGNLEWFLRALVLCPGLEKLDMQYVHSGETNLPPIERRDIFLPELRSLRIFEVSHVIAVPLLRFLVPENLKHLSVEYDDGPDCDAVAKGLLDTPHPPPCLTSMLNHLPVSPKHLTFEIDTVSLKIEDDRSNPDVEIQFWFIRAGPHWLSDLAQMENISLSACGVPLYFKVMEDDDWDEDTSFAIDLAPFTSMTSLYLTCGPRLTHRVIHTLREQATPASPWSCHRLAELRLGLGGRNMWQNDEAHQDRRWEALVEELKSLVGERNGADARNAGVARMTIYECSSDTTSTVVEDIDALYPAVETDSDTDTDEDVEEL